jgi:hypothetical protein
LPYALLRILIFLNKPQRAQRTQREERRGRREEGERHELLGIAIFLSLRFVEKENPLPGKLARIG